MITGWEWALIILVVLAVIMWGPKKIPELARALGEARAEFDRASREATTMVTRPVPARKEEKAESSSDDLLIETATRLGISTEGKTKEQISAEIVEKFKAGKEATA